MRTERRRINTKTLSLDNVPTFLVFVMLTIGLALFGADAKASSLFLSLLTFAVVVVSGFLCASLRPNKFVGLLLMLWLVFTAVSYFTKRTMGAEDEFFMLLAAIGVFLIGNYAGQSHGRIQTAWRIFIVFAFGFTAFAFLQHALAPNMTLGLDKPYHFGRLTGVFLSSNTAATFIGILLIVAIAQIYRTSKVVNARAEHHGVALVMELFQKSYLALMTVVLASVCLLLTASRAGIACSLFGLVVFCLWGLFQRLRANGPGEKLRLGSVLLIMSMLAAFGAYLWSLSGDLAGARFEMVAGDIKARSQMFEASWAAAKLKPGFGYGLGSLEYARLLGTTPENNFYVMRQNAAHNVYAQWLVQAGWVGCAILGAIYVYIVGVIFKGALRSRHYKTYCMSCLCIAILVCSHGVFDYAMEIPVVMLMHSWILGLGYGVSKKFVPSV